MPWLTASEYRKLRKIDTQMYLETARPDFGSFVGYTEGIPACIQEKLDHLRQTIVVHTVEGPALCLEAETVKKRTDAALKRVKVSGELGLRHGLQHPG